MCKSESLESLTLEMEIAEANAAARLVVKFANEDIAPLLPTVKSRNFFWTVLHNVLGNAIDLASKNGAE